MRWHLLGKSRTSRLSQLAVLLLGIGLLSGAEPPEKSADDELKRFQFLVGGWQGVGQPKRGSNQGAWREKVDVAWDWSGKRPELKSIWTENPQFDRGGLSYAADKKEFQFRLRQGEKVDRIYRGNFEKEVLVLETDELDGVIHRVTMTVIGENRVTWLFERRSSGQTFSTRVAEVAWQREGTKLAVADGSGPECVVTGGKGTIAVQHKGETYYVCCTGCRDAFQEDPEGILAEYRKKKSAKK